MRKWNVLHIFYHYPPIVTGYAKRSHEIVKHTASFAKSIIITAAIDKNKIAKEGITFSGNGEEIYRLRKVPLPPIKHIGHRFVGRFILEMAIRNVFKNHHFDLIHAHMPYVYALPLIQYAKKKGLKTIYEVRGIWEESAVAEDKIKSNSIKYQLRRKWEDKTIALADKIVVLSKPLVEELKLRGVNEDKIEFIGNAVDCSQFKPKPHSHQIEHFYHLKGKFVIGYVGTLRKMEGLQNILKILPALKEKKIPFAFFIVGHGEYSDKLKELAKNLHLEKDVVFTGAVPAEKVNLYYSVMDLLVFPRLRMRVTELVSPLKPLEAMAMGKPVLASRVGGLTDYCVDEVNALLFDPDYPNECFEKLLNLIQNDPLRIKLGKSACDWVQKNRDWNQIAEKYRHLYQTLTQKN